MLHRARMRPIPWLVVIVSVLAACSSSGSSPSSTAEEPGPSFTQLEVPGGSPVVGEVPAELVERVVAEAASGAGVDPADVEVVATEAVTWPDGSIGCPQPDQMYTQALVPGYRVVVDVDGEELSFHAAEDGEFAFCADPQPAVEDGIVDR